MSLLKNFNKKCLLVIMDGVGFNTDHSSNAIVEAKTPCLDELVNHYPHLTITAGGMQVGLPKGVAGNSEVGHMCIGSGRSVDQDLKTINTSITNHTLRKKEKLQELISHAKKSGGRIHLMGLLSDGGVHSHIDHLLEFMKIFSEEKSLEIFYHAFLDGRDTPPQSAKIYLETLVNAAPLNFHLASIQGRSIGMDRDRRWEKINQAYQMFTGQGETTSLSPLMYLEKEYRLGIFDEFITPVLFNSNSAMKENDSIFFLNFRPDRAIQLSMAFNLPNFKYFNRNFIPSYFLCMTPYIQDEMKLPILFEKNPLPGGLSEILSKKNLSQFKIAETEKFAHITFFFNGGKKDPFPLEERVLIPSPKEVKTYDLKPEMSAIKITDQLVEALQNREDSFYLVNYANCDMVGHTGNFPATISAVEYVDQCLSRLINTCSQKNIPVLITADHGNADQMKYPDGGPHTSHTNSPVPLILFHPSLKDVKFIPQEEAYSLIDITPTILDILGIEIPEYITGRPIFK